MAAQWHFARGKRTTIRFSAKGKYAVTALLDLALHSGNGPVTLADVSMGQGISLSYLERLFAVLRGKQLVRGIRGPGGGYSLGKPADEISIAEIINAVDDGNCHPTHDLWDQLCNELFGFLNNISLADLMRRGLGDGIGTDLSKIGGSARSLVASDL